MKTTASALLSALILFHVTASEMVVAQEAAAATTGGHHPLLRALKEGVPEMSFSSGMSMSMPTDEEGIVPPGPSSSSTGGGMANFLSKFKEEHVTLAETLSGKKLGGKVSGSGVTSSAFTSKMNGDTCDYITDANFEECVEEFIQFFDEIVGNTTCVAYGKSSKSDKSGGKNGPKIKKIGVTSVSTRLDPFPPSTIYNGVVLTPQIDVSSLLTGGGNNFLDAIFTSLVNLIVLERHLACAGSKIENLLTLDLFVTLEDDFAFPFYVALLALWSVRGLVEDDLPLAFVHLNFFPGEGFPIAVAATAAVN